MDRRVKKALGGMAAMATGLLVSGGGLLAQNAAIAPQAGESDVFYEAIGPGPGGPPDAIGFVEFERGVSGKTISGAPFTASFTRQTTQVLSDGNQIQLSTTGSLARDSQGRTRRDMTLPAIGPWAASGKPAPQMTFINDPVAGAQYTLDADRKIAHKMAARNDERGDHAKGERGASFAAERQKETTTTSLGTQVINGVSAEGTRTTRTIPAGEIGNQKPIVVTFEKWYSADLQETVMTKREDPRMGVTVFQLNNIQRVEPAATLFQVPADYAVKQGGHGPKGMRRHQVPGAGMLPDGPPPAGSSAPTP
jgi:hypothetical protein